MTDTVYFAYKANEECDSCIFGEAVTKEDGDAFHICFTSYIKKEEPCAGLIRRTIQNDG